MLFITGALLAAAASSSFLIFLLFLGPRLLLLLPIGLAPRKRRCPVICLDHQIKPSVRSSFPRGVTSLPTICLLTKGRRRRPLLCLSTASLHILLARSGGSKADQVAHVIFVRFFCCCFRDVGAPPPPLPPPSELLENCQEILIYFFFYLKDPQKTPHLMRLFVARKVSEQWWWWWRRRRPRQCVL